MALLPPKKKKEEGHANHERWVISYADLLTLLLATFVVLYASSTRNHHKEDEIAMAFIQAFHGNPPAIAAPPSGSRGVLQHNVAPIPQRIETPPRAATKLPQSMTKQLDAEMKALQALQMQLQKVFQPMTDAHEVSMTSTPLTMTIQLDASVLFDSGAATLKPAAASLLAKVGTGLTHLPPGFRVTVEGYTDNQPISTAQFPSNWSLSAERAVAVVSLFAANGVPGNALAAEGFGEFSPVASNANDAGRAQNRRVVVVVHAPDPAGDTGAAPSLGTIPGAGPAPGAGKG